MRAFLLLLVFLSLTWVSAQAQPTAAKSDLASAVVSASGAYAVPFASEGNVLELAVANTAAIAANEVRVAVSEAPA